MSDSTLWWLLAGGAVAVELLTGTFYLLMLAIGMVAAAVAAHLGAATTVQLIVAALFGAGAVTAWHLKRGGQPKGPPPGANRDINLDVGESIHVDTWNADGTATVRYRGAMWTVVPAPGAVPATGAHRVREVVGNRLVVDKT